MAQRKGLGVGGGTSKLAFSVVFSVWGKSPIVDPTSRHWRSENGLIQEYGLILQVSPIVQFHMTISYNDQQEQFYPIVAVRICIQDPPCHVFT